MFFKRGEICEIFKTIFFNRKRLLWNTFHRNDLRPQSLCWYYPSWPKFLYNNLSVYYVSYIWWSGSFARKIQYPYYHFLVSTATILYWLMSKSSNTFTIKIKIYTLFGNWDAKNENKVLSKTFLKTQRQDHFSSSVVFIINFEQGLYNFYYDYRLL